MKNLIMVAILFFSSLSHADNSIYYPGRPERLRIGGEVNVLYDINERGKTENIRFVSAEPEYVFNRSVKRQISRWIYPDGKPQKDVMLKVIFKEK